MAYAADTEAAFAANEPSLDGNGGYVVEGQAAGSYASVTSGQPVACQKKAAATRPRRRSLTT